MSDPKRLLAEEADSFERQMLGSVDIDEAASPGAFARCMATFAATGAAATGASTAKAAAAAGASGESLGTGAAAKVVFSGALAKWIGFGTACALATTGIGLAVVARHSAVQMPALPSSVQVLSSASANPRLAHETSPPTGGAVVDPRLVLDSDHEGTPIQPRRAEGARGETPSNATIRRPARPADRTRDPLAAPERILDAAPPVSTTALLPRRDEMLSREVAILDQVRGALLRRDAKSAISLLDRRESEFGGAGVLGQEALVLKVQALLLAGDRAAAARVGKAALATRPRGPQADRLRALLTDTNP